MTNSPPTPDGKQEPTKAQRELLVWMRRSELNGHKRAEQKTKLLRDAGFDEKEIERRVRTTRSVAREFMGGALIEYYRARSTKHRGGYADHGWRRAGGTALKRLADAGYAEVIGHQAGVVFSLNTLGVLWADHFIALEESIHD